MGFFGYMLNLVHNNRHEFWWGKLKIQTQRRKRFRSYIFIDMRSYDIAFMHGSDVTMLVIVAYLGIVERMDKYLCLENAGVV
ncbi:hypothetical protein Scep_026012 [Stephania cephalantha]|uniref:Uncharacterized protein n=1 Tax=Stephania cephalantha TaxID=152367 RepID=A0AAP0HMT7_9MAGN